MSNPKIRNLCLAVGALILVIILYLVVSEWQERKENRETSLENETAVEESIELLSIDSSTINKISFTNKEFSGNFTYSVETDLWTSAEHPEWTLDATKIDAILTAISSISATRELSEPDDLSSYDLNEPQLKVSLEATDEEETITYSFMIGSEAPGEGSYYFMEDGGDKVYVVDSTIFTAFAYNENQFIAVDAIESLESNNIYSMDIAKNDGSKVISYYYDGDKTDDTVAANWYVTAPYDKTMLGDETYIYQYMSNYASLAYSECVDIAPTDLAQYGLDNPAYTINFKYFNEEEVESESTDSDTVEDASESTDSGDSEDASESTDSGDSEDASEETKTETIITHKEITYYVGSAIMGPPEEDDTAATIGEMTGEETAEEVPLYYYVKSSASDKVFLMTADVISALVEVDSFEFVDEYINSRDIMSYDNLTISSEGKDYVIVKESVTETDEDGDEVISNTYSFNGFKASTKDGEDACAAISELAVSRVITEQVDDNTVVAQFKYTGGDGDVTVQFLPYNDNFYRVNKDGAEYFLIEKQDVDTVISTVKGLSE